MTVHHPLAKGTHVTVRWHNDTGFFRTTEGVVVGYEYRGEPEIWVSDGCERRIPLRSITSLEQNDGGER